MIGGSTPEIGQVLRFHLWTSVMGMVLALIVFNVTAFAVPLLFDRRALLVGAVTACVRAVFTNPAAMLAWAQELQVGSWFTLDHNNQISQVQFAWRSERKHLNLFASTSGKSFLIQGGRLAAYLQAGLLLPQEEEALTVRATRDAMAKLEANPERLLA